VKGHTITLALAVCSLPAAADVTVRAEPGVSGPVSSPARDYFGAGFHLGAALGYDVLRFLEAGVRVGYDYVSRAPSSPLEGPGSVLAVGPAVRGHFPWDSAYVPWLEASLLYARTGELDRFAFAASAGFHFVLPGRTLFIGPWIGFTQVFHVSDGPAYPTQDATIISGGVAVDFTIYRAGKTAAAEVLHDRDGDGVDDAEDACPDVPGLPKLRGCPDADPDHDGIVGAADRCPNEPEDKDGFEDEDGCPDPDNDADGVPDVDDACPNQAGPAATHGCPDRDGDGVADADDSCPMVRGAAQAHGCPTYANVTVTDTQLLLSAPPVFGPNSATLQPRSVAVLNDVVKAMTDRASVCVSIEAHSTAKYALARADAVRTWLMANGVAPSRMWAKGVVGDRVDGPVALVIVPCEVAAP
jgi:outer membrane protein OmpA-like peptidoglycan-associated protein